MKKRLAALLLVGLLALSASGCRGKIRTELPSEGLKAMISNRSGDLFLLDDYGLRRYNLSTDKKVEYIHSAEDFTDAHLDLTDRGEDITYTGLYIEKLLAANEEDVIMVGRYLNNNRGRDADMFVLQDASDLNLGAGFFAEVEKGEGNIVNGVSSDENGFLFKLTVDGSRGHDYKSGSRFNYVGQNYVFPLPDGVTGSMLNGGEENLRLLVETDGKVELTDAEGNTVKAFDRSAVADAFVDGNSLYVIYKNGRVTETSPDGEEKDFMTLKGRVPEAHDALFCDGELYWFDDEGVKTGA